MKENKPLYEMTEVLSLTAEGLEKADLVIKNGRLINVFTGEIIDGTDVAVKGGRIALVGDASHTIGEKTKIIDAQGMYLAPGFIDGHLHVESSMLTVCEYAKAAAAHGTSAIFMDPHEIANVCGIPGIRAMMEDAEKSMIRVYVTTPSCVPACPGLEDNGAVITPEDIAETMEWGHVAGLGEMMNYRAVTHGDSDAHKKIQATLQAGKPVTGHFPVPDTGAELNAYAAAGICCCHESTTAGQALAKMRLGMYAMIREGSAWHDLKEVVKAITDHTVDTRRAVLVSDDIHADNLLFQGHMDHIIRRAVEEGVKPVTAIQMATLNVAECFGVSQDIGAIAPGRFADINIISDLTKAVVEKVIIGGEVVAQNGCVTANAEHYDYSDEFRHTIKLTKKFMPEDFIIKTPMIGETAEVQVIEVHNAVVTTTKTTRRFPVIDGRILSQPEQDIYKVAVIDRHHESGRKSMGFVKGFNIKKGAVASTYAHDAHNLLIVGTNDSDMAFAANKLIECGGGMIAVQGGEVLALLKLPVAGLLSDRPAHEVAEKLESLAEAWRALGSEMVSPFMTMSLLSLCVIPEIRITNKGLVDVGKMKLTTLTI